MQQHGIAVGKEPVLLVNRMPIGRENAVLAGEGRNQHQQGAFWKMEIGDQGIDAADPVARENEDLGIAGKRFDRSIDNRRFQRTQHRGPDRDDTATTGFGSGNLCAQISTHIQPFTVHDMVFQMFRTHGLEGAGTHMQSDVADLNALGLQLRQQRLIEMQTGGWRSHRTGMSGEYSLVTRVIIRIGITLDIGRQGHAAEPVEHGFDRLFGFKAQAVEFIIPAKYGQYRAVRQGDTAPRFRGFRGTDLSTHALVGQQTLDQDFNLAAGLLLAVKPCRNDPGIVEDQQVAGLQQFRQITELPILERDITRRHQQQPGITSVGQWRLCDQLWQQIEVEIGFLHKAPNQALIVA